MPFNKDFVWGAATAAYQIEGAWDADGKGPSVWDQMAHWPGKTYQGQTGDVACDHYRRMEEDLDLMAEIGLKAYRFSFSWPRIFPAGTGRVNESGLAFYERLVDGLLARGIQPWGTLFHWCYPLALYHRGGWMHPDSPRWFAQYARVLGERLGDRVRNWITLNEPQMFVNLGHATGIHAPGLRLPPADIARIVHHVLLAHGEAVQALRAVCPQPPAIGWAPAVGVSAPAPGCEDDHDVVEAARTAQFSVSPDGEFANSASLWCDPVFLGRYPEAFLERHESLLPADWQNGMATIASPIDFCGLNIYAAWQHASRSPDGDVIIKPESQLPDGFPRSHFGWPVTPEALYWGPKFFHERYRTPIIITENGLSCHDWVGRDGYVSDPQRIDFTDRYLRELQRAAADGTDIRGYFHWSLMDNFEWAEAYRHRFGLVHVDFSTQKRTLKDSARWYRAVIARSGP